MRIFIASTVAAVSIACGPSLDGLDDHEQLATGAAELATDNGQSLNGQSLNGQSLNGQSLNGQSLNGQSLNGPEAGTFLSAVSLEGVKINGQILDSTTLSATMLTGHKGGSTISGLGFRGAELNGVRGDGSLVRVRIRDIVAPLSGDDVWRYWVDYRETDGNWYPICSDSTGALPSIPLRGTWNHAQGVPGGGAHTDNPLKATFACEQFGALGKCVGLGYKPWRSAQGVSLAGHHQACVRMLRGDYCGDGTPRTQNGNMVNVYDGVGVQADTESWIIEAEWDAAGARCFYPLNRSGETLTCYDERTDLSCGSLWNFTRGALLMSETPTGGLTAGRL